MGGHKKESLQLYYMVESFEISKKTKIKMENAT